MPRHAIRYIIIIIPSGAISELFLSFFFVPRSKVNGGVTRVREGSTKTHPLTMAAPSLHKLVRFLHLYSTHLPILGRQTLHKTRHIFLSLRKRQIRPPALPMLVHHPLFELMGAQPHNPKTPTLLIPSISLKYQAASLTAEVDLSLLQLSFFKII